MKRARLRITVDGTAEPRARLLEALREMGYTVTVDATQMRPSVTAADVLSPHGEIDPLPRYLGKPRRRA